jgi:signal transduction histidine kinase
VIARARAVLDRQVQHLTRIVGDLVDVSRIAERKIELRPQRIGLTTLVENALEPVARSWRRADIRCS